MRPVDERPAFPAPPPGLSGVAGPVGSFLASLVSSLTSLFQALGWRVNRTLPKDGSEPMTGPLELAQFTTASLPPAADHPWSVIAVTDGSAGQKFRASDGTSWVNLG